MLRRLLLTSASVLVAGSAVAADLPSRRAPAPVLAPPVPVFTWTGIYAGVNIGFGGDRFRYNVQNGFAGGGAFGGNGSLTSSGVIGGGQVGFNYQFSQFVLGLEADFQGARIRGNANLNVFAPGAAAFANAGSRIDYLGTIRGRLGYSFLDNRMLVYVTGGFAYANIVNTVNLGAGAGAVPVFASQRMGQYGYAVGGGVEYSFLPNWSIKTEYLYADMRNNNNNFFVGAPAAGVAALLNVRTSVHMVRAGINYRFNFGGAPLAAPVVARY